MEQRSDEWFKARLGRFTGSTISKLMGGPATREGEILQKVEEILTGGWREINAPSLEWGTKLEPALIYEYEKRTKQSVGDIAFVPFGEWGGCSPDGKILGKNKIIEGKCPSNGRYHLEALLIKDQEDFKNNATIKKRGYYNQVIWNMMVTGADACDWISYDPRFNSPLNMRIITIEHDQERWEEIQQAFIGAVEEAQAIINLIYQNNGML